MRPKNVQMAIRLQGPLFIYSGIAKTSISTWSKILHLTNSPSPHLELLFSQIWQLLESWEVGKHSRSLSHTRLLSRAKVFASLVVSNLLHLSITRRKHVNHEKKFNSTGELICSKNSQVSDKSTEIWVNCRPWGPFLESPETFRVT